MARSEGREGQKQNVVLLLNQTIEGTPIYHMPQAPANAVDGIN